MIVYHASKDVVEYPEIRKTKYTKDFSWGFYSGDYYQRAVLGYVDIGKLYAYIARTCNEGEDLSEMIENIFSSFISDEISKFETDVYYQNPDYIVESYKAGYLLD